MKDFAGKVVLVTGAGKGSGSALARAFAERSAFVAANDISPVNVGQVADGINRQGGRAKAYVEDVARKFGVQSIIKQLEDEFGHIDILVNHACVQPRVPLLEMDEWDWRRVLDVNLTGAFLMTQSVGRVMRGQGSGVIFNLIVPNQKSAGEEAALVTTMQGLEAFTRQAARELSPHGIRIHAVETGGDVVGRVFALLEEV